MMANRKRSLLLCTASVPALLIATAVTGCSRDTTASAADNEAARAANDAARSAALASGVASDAVDNLVAANDALLERIEVLETRLESRSVATDRADSISASRARDFDTEPRVLVPARDDSYRTADYIEERQGVAPATYDAPSSRWDEGYEERGTLYSDSGHARDVALRDDQWRARPVSRDLPRPRAPVRDEVRRSEPSYRRVTVDEGTPIAIEMLDPISTRYSQTGDAFTARLAGDLLADDGRVAIRDGAKVTGHVSELRKSQRIGGKPAITVVLDRIELPDGSSAPLQAAWATQGKSQTPKDAATIGGATVGGAILGRILDKGDGDVIGGLIGAAAGTAVARQKVGQPIVLDSGAILRMTLRAPIEVRVRN